MELKFEIRTGFLDEVTQIRELYEADIVSQVKEALPALEKQAGLDLLGIIYPIIEKRSMTDGLPLCIIFQIVRNIIDQYIADCRQSCFQKWILDLNGRVIVHLVDGNADMGAVSAPYDLASLVKEFFNDVVSELSQNKVGDGTSYHMNLNEIIKNHSGINADIHKGQLLIALIDQISFFTEETLKEIGVSRPSIGGVQDWYVDNDGKIMMELYLSEKQTGI